MERKKILLSILSFVLILLSPEASNAQNVKNRSFERAYNTARDRIEKAKETPISEFKYHIETVLSMNSAFKLNNLTLDGPEYHEQYKHHVPELMLRALFIKGGKHTRYGLEGGASYISAPSLNTKGIMTKIGISSGTMLNIGHNLYLKRGHSLGYMMVRNRDKFNDITGVGRGVYLSADTSILYRTWRRSAIGLNLSLNLYQLGDWDYTKGKPAPNHDSKIGFGLFPTLGITYYVGGL